MQFHFVRIYPNHKPKTPNEANDRLCPEIALGLPAFVYFPMHRPNSIAPNNTHTVSIDCAKSLTIVIIFSSMLYFLG
jgi:hypothetical protein